MVWEEEATHNSEDFSKNYFFINETFHLTATVVNQLLLSLLLLLLLLLCNMEALV